MHHKRGRARNQRAGCKLCKSWKVNGVRTERVNGEGFSDHRLRIVGDDLFAVR
jgi:uracil-DNA glycosylase